MSIIWLEREDIIPAVIRQLKNAEVVLDIGCGIMPQSYIIPKVHICCEPYIQYVEVLQERFRDKLDRTYIILNATWADATQIFPPKSVDTVFLMDVIEHLEKGEGLRLLEATERIAREQIVLFTPLGFRSQAQVGGKDAWNLEGVDWQKHKSGWVPGDFNDDWKILSCKDYHTMDNMGNTLAEPFGAIWAIWESPNYGCEQLQKYSDAPKSLWMNYCALQKEHESLQNEHRAIQQSRAIVLARKLKEHPLLMRLAETGYTLLSMIYRLIGKQ